MVIYYVDNWWLNKKKYTRSTKTRNKRHKRLHLEKKIAILTGQRVCYAQDKTSEDAVRL